MSNTLLTISQVTKEAMRLLHNSLTFAKNINMQYSDQYARSGAKIGANCAVRIPNRFIVTSNANFSSQTVTEESVTITLGTQKHVDFTFSSVEMTLSIDDFSNRYLKPAMAKLASQIDYDAMSMAKDVYWNVGTPGSVPGANTGSNLQTVNTPQIFLNAGRVLDDMATPRDGLRNVVMNPAAHAGAVAGLSGLFNSQAALSDQYRNGLIAKNVLGFDFYMDQNVNTLTAGSRANGTVAGANQVGANLAITAAGNNATVAAGDVFTIANVYAVNPESQQSTGVLQPFTVTAAANLGANGNATLTISPSIVVANANIANGTVNALPANGANLTWQSGNANAVTPMSLAFHRDAHAIVFADLDLPEGSAKCSREVYEGISLRWITQYDIDTDTNKTRIDVLYGYKTIRPEMSCRIWS